MPKAVLPEGYGPNLEGELRRKMGSEGLDEYLSCIGESTLYFDVLREMSLIWKVLRGRDKSETVIRDIEIVKERLMEMRIWLLAWRKRNPLPKFKLADIPQHKRTKWTHPFQCNICDVRFSYVTHLKRHIRTHLPDGKGKRSFKCTKCLTSFSRKRHLTNHTRIHDSVKPYSCNICGFATGKKTNLVRHFKTHSGEKPLQCPKCTYCATSIYNLKRHTRKKHPICNDK